MAHRRLAIQDLSKLGHQPMYSNNGRVGVVFNGEIYNFLDLKSKIPDYPFKSNYDTLIRDWIGKKPLYYYLDSENFYTDSTLMRQILFFSLNIN